MKSEFEWKGVTVFVQPGNYPGREQQSSKEGYECRTQDSQSKQRKETFGYWSRTEKEENYMKRIILFLAAAVLLLCAAAPAVRAEDTIPAEAGVQSVPETETQKNDSCDAGAEKNFSAEEKESLQIDIEDGSRLEPEETELLGIEEEAVFFTADAAAAAERSGEAVTLTVGKKVKYGSCSTNYFYINGQLAYCLEPRKSTPGGGSYAADVLSNGSLRKAMYYLMGGPGWPEVAPAFAGVSQDMSYAYCHCVLSWIYNNYDDSIFLGFGALGPQNGGQNFCKNVANWIARDFPEPPFAGAEITPASQEAYYDAESRMQRTGNYYLNADVRNQFSIPLPDGVALYDAATGVRMTGTAVITGGTSFYLEAGMEHAGKWQSGKLTGSISNDYLSFVIDTGGGSQDVGGLVHIEPKETTGFEVKWMEAGRILIRKSSAADGSKLSGAVFTISKKGGEEAARIVTDTAGEAYSPLLIPGEIYVVKEIEAPEGYRVSGQEEEGIEIYLDPEAERTEGIATVCVEVENQLASCDLEVRKRIRADEIVWANGNPVFIFTVDGTDLGGDSHCYSRVVEFDREYVEKEVQKDGFVEASARFEGIPCGTAYRIREAETSRYCLQNVTSADENVTIQKLAEPAAGKLPEEVFYVTADLLQKPTGTCVVFQNAKVKWNLWSHTDTVINRVRVS